MSKLIKDSLAVLKMVTIYFPGFLHSLQKGLNDIKSINPKFEGPKKSKNSGVDQVGLKNEVPGLTKHCLTACPCLLVCLICI